MKKFFVGRLTKNFKTTNNSILYALLCASTEEKDFTLEAQRGKTKGAKSRCPIEIPVDD